MKQLIEKHFGDVVLVEEKETYLSIVCKKNGATASIFPEQKWVDVKRHIQSKLDGDFKGTHCNACAKPMAKGVNCVKCLNYMCTDCYIERFRKGMGVIECPVCHDKLGSKLDQFQVLMGVYEMKLKTGKVEY